VKRLVSQIKRELNLGESKHWAAYQADTIDLQNAIRSTHGCESRWEASVRVEEKFEAKTAWSGIVEVFALVDHRKRNMPMPGPAETAIRTRQAWS